MLLAIMGIKQIRSVLFYITCVFLMQVNASELNNDAIYERMADIMLENKLLRLELEAAVRNMGQQADRITNVEKQVDKIANLEEATEKIKTQTDKITNLRKATRKMKKQDERITKLEETVDKIENKANGITGIETAVLKLNTQVAKLENSTLKNEKAISGVKFLATDHDMKAAKEMDKESDRQRKTLNEANGEIQQLKTRTEKVESRQEKLQEKIDKESDHNTQTLNEASGKIQRLESRIVNVETRQRKRAAFTVYWPSRQSNGILKFSLVHLNEGYVYSKSTGKFTSPYAGIYGFTASIIETGRGDNRISCSIKKNGYNYIFMYSWQGEIDGTRATDGRGKATAAATLHLVKGDSVHVWCQSVTGTALYHSSFTGFLINPDP
ncbi:uncharacterized protein LOC128558391 [Mercenaria mercenaria]|uniref:uncharacterized protein LOC128558391 n=1 Tax=Mercenaria mercenaria TaxID=6596 RepID=UPI00234F86C3|nr:uncharacterized protein LOC128558391 [Mercenaria mercenaria]